MNLNGLEVDYTYDNDGNVTKREIENTIEERFWWSSDNELTKYENFNGDQTEFTYDSDGNLLKIEEPCAGCEINMTYNWWGGRTSVTNQENIIVNYTFDNSDGALLGITAPLGYNGSFTYDTINRMLSKTINGQTELMSYDNNDNITSHTNIGGFTTTFDYDDNDNMVKITNAKNIPIIIEYNDEDRPIKERFGNSSNQLVKEYDYNDDGTLDKLTKPSNATIQYDYDSDGRLEETGTITDIDYDGDNLVKRIYNNNGHIRLYYDNLNRIDKVKTTNNYYVEYDHINSGHIKEIEYPTINNKEVKLEYLYDNKNRIKRVYLNKNFGTSVQLLAEYDYFKDNRIKKIELGGNASTAKYSYDALGRITEIRHYAGNIDSILYAVNLTYDNVGNIIEELETFVRTPPTTNSGGTGGPSQYYINWPYNYDDHNHITSSPVNSSDNVNDDGNTTQGKFFGCVYDIDDRLLNASGGTYEFKYNPLGQRIWSSVFGEEKTFIRDILQDNVIVELDSNTNVEFYYLYDPNGRLIARCSPSGDIRYYHGDLRGSTIVLSDSAGGITHQYRYGKWGSWKDGWTQGLEKLTRFRYMGTYGVETDWHDKIYARARYYDPGLGRFITEDPVWSTNLYPYAGNNPINRVDPNGNTPMTLWMGLQGLEHYNNAFTWSTQKGSQACNYYIDGVINGPGGLTYLGNGIGAGFSCLWTEENAWITESVLTLGIGSSASFAAKGGMKAIQAGKYTFTNTAARHLAKRPYMNSPSTITNIMKSGKGVADEFFKGGVNYKVHGTFNGSKGIYELGINPNTNTIYHFLFKSIK